MQYTVSQTGGGWSVSEGDRAIAFCRLELDARAIADAMGLRRDLAAHALMADTPQEAWSPEEILRQEG